MGYLFVNIIARFHNEPRFFLHYSVIEYTMHTASHLADSGFWPNFSVTPMVAFRIPICLRENLF